MCIKFKEKRSDRNYNLKKNIITCEEDNDKCC